MSLNGFRHAYAIGKTVTQQSTKLLFRPAGFLSPIAAQVVATVYCSETSAYGTKEVLRIYHSIAMIRKGAHSTTILWNDTRSTSTAPCFAGGLSATDSAIVEVRKGVTSAPHTIALLPI